MIFSRFLYHLRQHQEDLVADVRHLAINFNYYIMRDVIFVPSQFRERLIHICANIVAQFYVRLAILLAIRHQQLLQVEFRHGIALFWNPRVPKSVTRVSIFFFTERVFVCLTVSVLLVSLSFCLCLPMSACVCLRLSHSVCACLSLSVCLSVFVHLPVCMSLSACPSVRLCLAVRLSIYLSVSLSL